MSAKSFPDMFPPLKAQGVAHVKIKSVTDSLFLWGAIMMGSSLSTSWFAPLWMSIISISFSGLFLLVGLGFYTFFAIKDPKYLRSEVFHHNMAVLENNMGSKDQPISIDRFNALNNIPNPDYADATEENNEDKR